jgi:hypothetical protein
MRRSSKLRLIILTPLDTREFPHIANADSAAVIVIRQIPPIASFCRLRSAKKIIATPVLSVVKS